MQVAAPFSPPGRTVLPTAPDACLLRRNRAGRLPKIRYNTAMETIRPAILQRPQDLKLAMLLDDTLSGLHIFRQTQITCGRWNFHFAIIGESHFVRVTHDDRFIMQEVLACIDLPDNLRGNVHALHTLEPYQYDSQRYQVRIAASHQPDVRPSDCDGMLEHQFPITCGAIPVTRICWWQHDHSLRWNTLHSYPAPDRNTYIVSESCFYLFAEESDL